MEEGAALSPFHWSLCHFLDALHGWGGQCGVVCGDDLTLVVPSDRGGF